MGPGSTCGIVRYLGESIVADKVVVLQGGCCCYVLERPCQDDIDDLVMGVDESMGVLGR